MENNLLELHRLSKRYEGFSLTDVSFTVEAGSIVGLVGANGAGKTTTIKCVLGVIRPDEGSVLLMGEEASPAESGFVGPKRFAQLRQEVGFVPDTCAFPLEYSVSSVGALCSKAFTHWDGARFDSLCKEFDLSRDKLVKDLSRGMGMKLSLACALAHTPKLLVLDEATAGLDPLAREEVVGYLRDYVAREQCGVLMSSHITSDLERAADRVVCIDEGKVAFDQDIDSICDLAGIAHCRAVELEEILLSRAYDAGVLRLRRSPYATDVLAPDRFQFAEAFPGIAVDRASIDDYLSLMLKGEQA